MQARHEYKHSLNYMDYRILQSRLKAVLAHDSNTNEQGEYSVRSLYFDTPKDRALKEKIDGVDRREKFRIRRYGNDTDFLRLEKKSKQHGLCYKRSVNISKHELNAIINNDLQWMAQDERELVVELYSKMSAQLLRPKTIVEYIREPFVYPPGNVRITLDRDLRTGLFSLDFLNDQLPIISAGDEIVLLEVKYDNFIPDFIVKLLQLQHRRASACSKYALARVFG